MDRIACESKQKRQKSIFVTNQKKLLTVLMPATFGGQFEKHFKKCRKCFCITLFCTALMCLITHWFGNFLAQATHKMLVKLNHGQIHQLFCILEMCWCVGFGVKCAILFLKQNYEQMSISSTFYAHFLCEILAPNITKLKRICNFVSAL